MDFFFNDTATTEIYTLSLHDALPISRRHLDRPPGAAVQPAPARAVRVPHEPGRDLDRERRPARAGPAPGGHGRAHGAVQRSEEHTSELQSRQYLVCRLLLEKKKSRTL